jgi:hypothetical protein
MLGRRNDIALAKPAASLCLFLLAGELSVRLLVPNAVASGPDALRRVRLIQDQALVRQCRLLDPDAFPEPFADRFAGRGRGRRTVLHVGDSMVEGNVSDYAKRAGFVEVLDARDPETDHLNAGLAATSTDYHYALIHALLDRLEPDLVVLYVFANDPAEFGNPFPCCRGRKLVAFEPQLALRCPKLQWSQSNLARVLSQSPPPYWLRIATSVSAMAEEMVRAYWRVSYRLRGYVDYDLDESRQRMMQLVEALRDELSERGIDFLVVAMPYRVDLEAAAGIGEPSQTPDVIRRSLREAGLSALDPWQEMLSAVQARTPGLWSDLAGPNDYHLGPAGAEIMADWLAPRLTRRGGNPPS